MITYAEVECFSKEDLRYLRRATRLMRAVPTKINRRWVRCHEVARFVGETLGLDVVDGSFGAMEHSWCMLPSGNVLDVYVPAAVPSVQIVDAKWLGAPARYRTGEPRRDIRRSVMKALHSLRTAKAIPGGEKR